jgi:hypothetical protein
MDREHAKYLEKHYQQEPGDAHLYDLILNLGFIDAGKAVNIICLSVSR